MKSFLLQKQESMFLITKSLNEYPIIKAEISHEIQPLENYENNTLVFDDTLLSEQACNFDLSCTRGCHSNIDIYNISQIYFHLSKKQFVKILLNLFYSNILRGISYSSFMI